MPLFSAKTVEPILREMISRVDIETAYGPKISIKDPFDPDAKASRYVVAMKPTVKIYSRDASAAPITIAPYGESKKTKWPVVRNGAITVAMIGLAGLAVLTSKALRNNSKR